MQNGNNQAIGVLFLFFPLFVLVTLILVLFGQEYDSLQKVFTETATWKLSQHDPPPLVYDRHGHDLCTVAAHGTPRLVKPIGIDTRHGKAIVVNRQLKIANAFEEMIQIISPSFHKIVRRLYDVYGLNLSTRINTEFRSNLIYVIMKPMEWLFLICLYLFFHKPENVIGRQYFRI